MTRMWRLVLALAVALCAAGCCWSRPAGPSAESGDVRVTVTSAEAAAGETLRVGIAVTNLRSWTEFDGEFYLGEMSLQDEDGYPVGRATGIASAGSASDDLETDYVPAAATVVFVVEFADVVTRPSFLVYDSWESGVLRVPLDPEVEP